MAFPGSPSNNQTTVVNGITYIYNSTIGSWTRLTNNTFSGNITTTANIVANGAYISGNAIIGGNLQVTGNVTYLNYDTITYTETANAIVANIVTVSGNISAGNVIISGTEYSSNIVTGNISAGNVIISGTEYSSNIVTGNITAGNVLANLYGTQFGNTVGTTATYSGNITAGNIISNLYSPVVNINSTLGGYNVLNITGAALPAYGSQSWSFFTQNLRLTGGAGSWILFPDSSTQTTAYPGTLLSGSSTLAITTLNAATIGNTGAALTGTTVNVLGTTNSTGTSTGALQVAGGVGVGGNVYVGGNVVVTGNVISGTGNITVQSFTGNTGQFYGNAAGFTALYAGIPSGYSATPDTIIQSAGNFNSYVQNNSQNINAGSQATTDWVATASNGTDTTYYVDLGIAGGGYSNASPYNSLGTSLWPNDAYLYAQGNVAGQPGGNLVVGTSIPGTVTRILAGGVNSSNVVATFANTGVTVSGNLTVSGNITGNISGNTVAAQGTFGNLTITGFHIIGGNTPSTSDTTGALQVAGGVGVQGNVYIGSNVFVQSNATSQTYTRVEYNIPHPFLLMGAS
jgi:hypothetical protein